METFAKLFGSLVVFVYHCFDRMVILGHMPLLTRPEHIVHFFRDVHGTYPITKEALRQRTNEYHRWVDAFARKQDIPVEWAQKGFRKEDYVRPSLHRMERQQRFGVYFILKSMEVGPSFRISAPKFPTADPHYRLIAPQRGRYTHYYFYIRDEVLGPMLLCVGPSCRSTSPTTSTAITSSSEMAVQPGPGARFAACDPTRGGLSKSQPGDPAGPGTSRSLNA